MEASSNKQYDRWMDHEVQTLLAIFGEDEIQRDLATPIRNGRVYARIAERLLHLGICHSAKQVREKLKKLKQDYKKIKDHNNKNGYHHHRTSKWFDRLDALLGHRPAYSVTSQSINPPRFSSEESQTAVPLGTDSSMSTIDDVTVSTPNVTRHKIGSMQIPSRASSSLNTQRSSPWSWSNDELAALVTLWAQPMIQKEFILNKAHHKVYPYLSDKLAEIGIIKLSQQCRAKIKYLKKEYKRIKTGLHESKKKNCVWFKIMDQVFFSRSPAENQLQIEEPEEYSSTEPSLLTELDVMDFVSNGDIEWLPDEVQILLTLWAQETIQKQLLTPSADSQVFTYLSNELALVGFNKTPLQCSLKVESLKAEYQKIQQTGVNGCVGGNWFAIMDSVLGPGAEGQNDVKPCALLTELKLEEEDMDDTLGVTWTSHEVHLLLQCWAKDDIQQQVRSSDTSDRVFALLSSKLATYGFDKTTLQCKAKLELLKKAYIQIKEQDDDVQKGSTWFLIMDKIVGEHQQEGVTMPTAPDSATGSLPAQKNIPVPEPGCRMSISSLCLLVPTLRLMCAFAWQVVRSCNVAHFGKVDELVRLVTELVPGVLAPKEKAQLLLRLRAKLVLELCRNESTANILNIEPHMKVIQELEISSSRNQEEEEELENSKSNFKEVVGALLKDVEERERFFKEIFPLHYGQKYEVTLHSLTWNFISKLDHLLPVPDIKQTAEWLSAAPSVLEECGRMDLEQNHLKMLLRFHEEQLGYTHKDYFEAKNTFLPRLTLYSKSSPRNCKHKEQDICKPRTGEEGADALGLSNTESLSLDIKKRSFLNDSSLPVATCCLCPYTHSKLSGLFEHIKKEHLIMESSCFPPGEVEGTKEANSPTYSPETSVSNLNLQKKSHLQEYQCDKCNKNYSSNSSLIVHRRIHTGEAPFLCSYCGRSFRSKGILDWHIRAHTGDRRYKCHICGKTSVQHLARHMRMHRGEKNYLCSHCGKAFLSSVELRLHTRYHTGERPYKCRQCRKGFVAKCHLMRHMLMHTGDRPHRCLSCPKSFTSLKAKKRHMIIHQNKKSFQCLHCGKIFRIESTLKKHMETHS